MIRRPPRSTLFPYPPLSRSPPPADEEIDVAVSIVVGCCPPRAAHVSARPAPARFAEVAPPAVQVQPVLERGRHRRDLATAAHDVQIGVPVAVGVEEHRAQVFGYYVRVEQFLVGAHEPAVGLLDQQLPRLTLRASDEHVFPARRRRDRRRRLDRSRLLPPASRSRLRSAGSRPPCGSCPARRSGTAGPGARAPSPRTRYRRSRRTDRGARRRRRRRTPRPGLRILRPRRTVSRWCSRTGRRAAGSAAYPPDPWRRR